jgi:hypothetical protein
MSAIDDWLDGDDVDLTAALADPAARRDLVELSMIEALLPRAAPLPRKRSRTAAIAAVIVVVAMIAVLLVRPRHRDDDTAIVTPESDGRVNAAGDRTTLADGGTVIASADRHIVDTPVGPVVVAKDTRALLRASASPPALYVEVIAGEATVGDEHLRAGQRAAYGDAGARHRLGPRVVVELLRLDAHRLEARLPSGETKAYVVSMTVAIEAAVERGDNVELVLSPDEHEVFVIRRTR